MGRYGEERSTARASRRLVSTLCRAPLKNEVPPIASHHRCGAAPAWLRRQGTLTIGPKKNTSVWKTISTVALGGTMGKDFKRSSDAWAALEEHFRSHAAAVQRFRSSGPRDVVLMWRRGTNERGEPLSPFERQALIERHCELFGCWP
jgi:hypothetical protein